MKREEFIRALQFNRNPDAEIYIDDNCSKLLEVDDFGEDLYSKKEIIIKPKGKVYVGTEAYLKQTAVDYINEGNELGINIIRQLISQAIDNTKEGTEYYLALNRLKNKLF
jgi:hypothetical protein